MSKSQINILIVTSDESILSKLGLIKKREDIKKKTKNKHDVETLKKKHLKG